MSRHSELVVNTGTGLPERHFRIRLDAGLYDVKNARVAVPMDIDAIYTVDAPVGVYIETLVKQRDELREVVDKTRLTLKMVDGHMSPYQPKIAKAVRETLDELRNTLEGK